MPESQSQSAGGETPQWPPQDPVSWVEQASALLNAFPEAVWLLNKEGRLAAWNVRAEDLCGHQRAVLQSLQIQQLLSPEPGTNIEDLLSRNEASRCRAALLTARGGSIPVEITLTPLRDGPGVLCTVKPGPSVAQHHLELLPSNLLDLILIYDMEHKLVFANPALERMTGHTDSELDAGSLVWVHPDDRPLLLSLWERTFLGESFEDREYRLNTKDGSIRWVTASWGPLLDETGKQVGVRVCEREITALKLREPGGIHETEGHYRNLFDHSPVPIWEEDFSSVKTFLDSLAPQASGNWREYLAAHPDIVQEAIRRVQILDVNNAARVFYGASSREELIKGFQSLFDAASCEVFREELAAFAAGQTSFQADFNALTLPGEHRMVNILVSIEPTAANDWSRVIVSTIDLTARKRLDEQFLQSQKMESLGRLAGGVAHDINNLLTVINGYCDLLLGRLPQDDPSRPWLAEIRKSGQHGADLMLQLLAFSRRQAMLPRPMNLNDLIRESETLMRRLVGEDIGVVTLLDPGAGAVEADPALMRQLLLNLLAHAREVMPRGGVLTLQTHNVWLDNNQVELPDQSGWPFVVLRVSDTGPGMDEGTRRHLFEPFFAGHGARGAGLGLAAAFGIAAQQGGHIHVDSEPGRGATFSVYLPRVEAPLPLKEAPAGQTQEAGTVLIAEDQPEVRALAAAILRRLGYSILEAANGPEALVIAERHSGHIQLLLTDIVMPGMTGLELAAQFSVRRPDARVIYMSGYMDRDLGGSGLDPSAPFLQKPFTPDALAAVIRRVLEPRQAV